MTNEDIKGSGGKGGGSQFFEEDNTLQSVATVRVLEVLSEGEIIGLVGGGKGIYINNTPAENADGTKNFGGKVVFDPREGLPDQPHMSGFPSASTEVSVNTQVTNAAPVVYTLSDGTVDAVRVTIGLPEGLYQNDTSNNRVGGSSVELAIERRLGAGTWTQVKRFKIEGKSTAAYEEGHRIPRPDPNGTGLWSIRVLRITADNGTATLRNATWVNRVTEIEDAKLTYPNVAYIGLGVDAKSVGSSSVPTRSYLIDGVKVKVPSNYNPTTRAYTGIWNGTFKFAHTSNPAWVLYDMLANVRYGLGEWVTESLIDKYSFYDAGVYCDALVDNGNGGTEPRFTFNYPITSRQDAAKWIQDIAGAMNAKVVWIGGKATVIQDRPASVARLITTSNVVDGLFTYRSSPQAERVTAVNVTWNDPDQHYQQSIATVDEYTIKAGSLQSKVALSRSRYGYEPTDIVALGCTSEGQARRAGLWRLDTSLNQTEVVSFKQFLNGYDLMVGDIVEVFDEYYAGSQQAGRLKAGSSTTSIILDRSVTLTSGSKIELRHTDGTVIQRNISQTSGTLSTVTVTSALPAAPAEYTDYIITTSLAPRQFRIVKTLLTDDGKVAIDAIYHDPNKYARIEGGVELLNPVFSNVNDYTVGAASGFVFREGQVNEDNTITRSLIVSWQRPLTGTVVAYKFKYQVNNGGWITIETSAPSVEINNAIPGTYNVEVYAVGYNNVLGPKITGSYTVSMLLGTSPLNPVTNLQVVGGGSAFNARSLTCEWTNPISNASVPSATIRNFQVAVLDAGTNAVLRTVYVAPELPGNTARYTYTFDDNLVDGGPRRSFKVEVKIRDANDRMTNPTTVTFTNPTPAVPSNIVLENNPEGFSIGFDPVSTPDVVGYIVWASTISGYSPNLATRFSLGTETYKSYFDLPSSTTYYVRVAAYDTFSSGAELETGAGLTISPEYTITTTSSSAATNTGIMYAYQRSATVLTSNPGNVTYDFTVAAITTPATDSLANGWTKTIPAGTNPLYVTTASAANTSATDSILAAEWSTPVVLAESGTSGTNGTDGLSVATCYLYRRTASSTPPSITGSTPTNTLTYTFATGVLSGTPPTGWSTTIPTIGDPYLWVTTATAANTGVSDTILYTEWAAARSLAQDGIDGTAYSTGIAYAYKRAASAPADNPGAVTYDFTTATITTASLANGWTKTIPAANGNPLYVITASAASATTTDSILAGEWGGPTKLTEDGIDGVDGTNGVNGLNTATVYLYQRNASASTPSVATTGSATYTFSTGVLSGTIPSGWTQAIPASGGDYLWVTTTVASNTTATDTIANTEWTTAKQLSVNGADGTNGTNGTNGTRTAVLDLYKWLSTAPTSTWPSGTSTYTWSTGQFTSPGTLNGWTQTPGSGPSGWVLYICRQIYSDSGTSATSNVTWSATSARPTGGVGNDGANGWRTAFLEVYKWASTQPTTNFPSGQSNYTWATGAFTTPTTANGWSLTPGAPTAGWTLWACSVTYADQLTTLSSAVVWNTSTSYAVGYSGANGVTGARGSLSLYISGSTPLTSAECDAAVLAQTGSATKIIGDEVTESNGSTYVSVLRWNGSSWVAPGVVIDGSLIVSGSVTAAKINSNGLDIRDASGNVIFSANKDLDMSRLQTSVDFLPYLVSDFNNTNSGWLGTTMTLSYPNVNTMRITPTAADSNIYLPTNAISVPGGKYNKIRARIKRIGGSGWEGTLFYATSGHSFSGSYYKTLDTAYKPVIGEWIIVEWDMEALTVGGTDWTNNTITSIRIDFGTTISDVFDIDWIAIGRHGPLYIDSVNASTYIANAAIGWAQIGNLEIASTGAVRSGQSAYHTGTGWWLGHVGGVPKFSIGNPAAQYMTWDGTNLKVNTTVANITPIGVQANVGRDVYAFLLGASGTAGAYLYFYNDGTIRQKINSGSVTTVGNWYNPTTTSIGSSYYINFTKVSQFQGTFTGTLNTWTLMSATQTISLTNATLWVEATTLVNVKIATDSGGTNIVGTGQCFLTAAREA